MVESNFFAHAEHSSSNTFVRLVISESLSQAFLAIL
jgi:hypothetical protein